MFQEIERKMYSEFYIQDVNDFHALTLIYRVEMIRIHPKPYIKYNWWLSVNYDVKQYFVTAQHSMKRSFDSRTALFWGAQTSISQITFQKLSDAKISKCSNEHMPRPPNWMFWNKLTVQSRSARTSTLLLERARVFWFRCYVLA